MQRPDDPTKPTHLAVLWIVRLSFSSVAHFMMDHPPLHRDSLLQQFIGQGRVDRSERGDPPGGDGEVDRSEVIRV